MGDRNSSLALFQITQIFFKAVEEWQKKTLSFENKPAALFYSQAIAPKNICLELINLGELSNTSHSKLTDLTINSTA